MDLTTLILTVASLGGLYMAWTIGANDVANAMGTSVGSGALTLRGAIVVAAIFEFGGAMLVGGSVTDTIRKGIVDIQALGSDPMVMAIGMTCCLLAAALWLNLATYAGWPVSTTHSIVGAVVGFGVSAGGTGAVDWGMVGSIAASWIVSPVMGGVLGYALFVFIQRTILTAPDPVLAIKRWGPIFVFPIITILALSAMFKGLKPLRLDLALGPALILALGIGLVCSLAAVPIFARFARTNSDAKGAALGRTEKVFMVLQVMTACFVAFAHGSNDVANAVGPLAAVFGAIKEGVTETVQVPYRVLLIGGVGIVVGLATYGYKIMATIGKKITELTPSRGFSAEFAAATTIVVASKLGLPVSTTHTLVGAVIGVGFGRSIGAINTRVLRGIFASWFITVPFTALLASGLFVVARLLLL
ncbi:MAG: inorganic phosphate transporter [Deltaproteobacteria bacterium]|jgi:PiT family inorganic phosphate transporter|nr:inorganic phosphate transporter [Deltaproteobacteria bacterium]